MINVLLADDNAQFRGVLRRLLERDPDIEVVGEASNGIEAIALTDELRPDVVMMDVSMPNLDGIQATYELKQRYPGLVVLMLSIGNKSQEIAAGLAGGADDYLIKGAPSNEIVGAIKRHSALVHGV